MRKMTYGKTYGSRDYEREFFAALRRPTFIFQAVQDYSPSICTRSIVMNRKVKGILVELCNSYCDCDYGSTDGLKGKPLRRFYERARKLTYELFPKGISFKSMILFIESFDFSHLQKKHQLSVEFIHNLVRGLVVHLLGICWAFDKYYRQRTPTVFGQIRKKKETKCIKKKFELLKSA